LAARRKANGEKMDVDEVPKNGSTTDSKDKFKKPISEKKDMEEGEVVESDEVAAPTRSKWKQGTGASIDLSRIRSFAARVDAEQSGDDSNEEEG
jgi:hypothetical protein